MRDVAGRALPVVVDPNAPYVTPANIASIIDPVSARREPESLIRQYDRAASTVDLLRPVLRQVARYRDQHPDVPVRIQTQMFRASHGRFYPRSFWPTEASTRATPWGDATRPRWFTDRDGRELVEYDMSASQSQLMGVFLGLPELEAAACSSSPRFKEYLAGVAWRMVAEKAIAPSQPRCTDLRLQFREAPGLSAYMEPHDVAGRIVYDPRLVAMVKQAWMTFTYGSPPNEIIKTLRDDPELYGPGFGGEYVRTITKGARKGKHRVDGGARNLMAFFRALPWVAKIRDYLTTCTQITNAVDAHAGFLVTDPLDRVPFRWNPVAVRNRGETGEPFVEVKSVGGNHVPLDVACEVLRAKNEPLRIKDKTRMETADGYAWTEIDEVEIQPRAKTRSIYRPAMSTAGAYPIDRAQLGRQLAPQIIHLLDSYFAALVVRELHRRHVQDMVVVHDAFCVIADHVPALLSAIEEASKTWFLGLGPVYKSLLEALPGGGVALPLLKDARERWDERKRSKDFPAVRRPADLVAGSPLPRQRLGPNVRRGRTTAQHPRKGVKCMTIDTSKLVSIAQAAKRSPLSESAIRARIDRGEIPTIRIDRRVYLQEEALIAALGDLYQPA